MTNQPKASLEAYLETSSDLRGSHPAHRSDVIRAAIARTRARKLQRDADKQLEAKRRRIVLAVPSVIDAVFKKLDKL